MLKETYKIIINDQVLRDFIDWLPDLKPNEQYYYSLLARNKYLADKSIVKEDKICLKRGTSTKEYLHRKIMQLEIPVGSYMHDTYSIPQEALALYISLNPRDMVLATKNLLKTCADLITSPKLNYNPSAEALSAIQKACGTKKYLDFDFDNKTPDELYKDIFAVVNQNAVTFIKTRGGFHCLVDYKKVSKEYPKWYQNIIALPGCDLRATKPNKDEGEEESKSNTLIPVPGCTQGNFMPYFWNRYL